ncbi:hypothetical protein SARC_05793 [Sphaeroforma arctica JP610]|uniref:C2H2-type domain-containing protein n=1 Tax=Sphaeroforma arctica JP610 TaxID=667725 RepID=A0A0L0G128_9EUKA|nr:hypothetical protein SARC_05793 [Sphaeroforma arctica JP610]KNC81903.1 hypothetical protein SARC_05793 [Sphaeroforma arctica JP610]|eukprot:XP_014155805.1 hypothetical protein SARC_05793 [Sphaeroforma arctica JP610]
MLRPQSPTDELMQLPIHTTRVRRKYSETERPYKCEECDRSYAFQQSKKFHKRTKHRGIESNAATIYGKIPIQNVPLSTSSVGANYRYDSRAVSKTCANRRSATVPSSDLGKLNITNEAHERLSGNMSHSTHENKSRSRHPQQPNVQGRLPYTRMESKQDTARCNAMRTSSLIDSNSSLSDFSSQLQSTCGIANLPARLPSQTNRATTIATSGSSDLDWLYLRCSGVPSTTDTNVPASWAMATLSPTNSAAHLAGYGSVDPLEFPIIGQVDKAVSPNLQFSQLFDTFVNEQNQKQASGTHMVSNCAQTQGGVNARRQYPTGYVKTANWVNTDNCDGNVSDGSNSTRTQSTSDTRTVAMQAPCSRRDANKKYVRVADIPKYKFGLKQQYEPR